MSMRLALACVVLGLALPEAPVHAADAARHIPDLIYATVDGKALGLDLHLPGGVRHPPLVVFVHGGAWTTGSKTQYPAFLLDRGFAVASLDFRSSSDAPFPADVFDIKAGIRYLRAKAPQYGYRADYFGARDLTTILAQSTPAGLAVRAPALQRLLGNSPDKVPDLAKLASPIFHVERSAPPIMLLHGDQDTQMPLNQLYEMQWAYEQVGRHAEVLILHGVDHDAVPFFRDAPVARVVKFLRRTIG